MWYIEPVFTVNEPLSRASKLQETARTSRRELDHALVERIKNGDRAAFRELFDRYHRRALAVARGVVKNEQDALDVIQDAFVKVHKNIDKFEGTSSFYTWLYRIVMNLSIDHIRKTKRRKHVDFDEQVKRDEATSSSLGTPSQSLDANPGRAALNRELGGAIQSALDELPEHHRAVIVLREVEGLSYEEIAKVLDVPKGTIMSRLFHARRKMQTALEPYLKNAETGS